MTKILTTICAVLFVFSVTAQETNKKKSVILVSARAFGYTSVDTSEFGLIYVRHKTANVIPSVSFLLLTKGANYHDFGINQLKMNTSKLEIFDPAPGIQPNNLFQGRRERTFDLVLVYGFNYSVIKNPDAKVKPAIGLVMMPRYQRTAIFPLVTNTFPTSTTSYGFDVAFLPRIQFIPAERWIIDLGVELDFVDFTRVVNNTDNPQLPKDQRRVGTGTFDVFETQFIARVGVGVRF